MAKIIEFSKADLSKIEQLKDFLRSSVKAPDLLQNILDFINVAITDPYNSYNSIIKSIRDRFGKAVNVIPENKNMKKADKLNKIIREELDSVLKEVVKFPARKTDESFKKLITASQKLPKWDEKPRRGRQSAINSVEGTIRGIDVAFDWNEPGPYYPIYIFNGLTSYERGNSYPTHDKSGKAIHKFLDDEIEKVAKEKKMSPRIPMTWLVASRNIPEKLILDNIKEFKDAIESVSKSKVKEAANKK